MSGFKSFRDMKKGSSLQALVEKTKEMTKGSYEADERYWEPSVDKNGNGSAIIRFLPSPEGEDIPFVRLWTHGFKGPTGLWYIENSRTTLKEDDPVTCCGFSW